MRSSVDGVMTRRARLMAVRMAVRMEEGRAELYGRWGERFAPQPLGATCVRRRDAARTRARFLRLIAPEIVLQRPPATMDVLRLVREGLERLWQIELMADLHPGDVAGLLRELESSPADAAVDWLMRVSPPAARPEQPPASLTSGLGGTLADRPG